MIRLTSVVAAVMLAFVPAAVASIADARSMHSNSAGGSLSSAQPAGVCGEGANGQVVRCPRPPAVRLLPPAARSNAAVTGPVAKPAALVDTRTWTSGGGNTYPGANVPFGMIAWSPDTAPHRTDGGGYTYGDSKLIGYSLTHVSGPGCPAAGDIPILPMTGNLPSGTPTNVTTSFSNGGEVAQAGYYSARSNAPSTITAQFAATSHSAEGVFTFPKTTMADFLIKLRDSELSEGQSQVKVIGSNEVQGSITTSAFCWKTTAMEGGLRQDYTVYFDIIFSQPFRSARVITLAGQSYPNSAFVVFNTMSNQAISAKVGISYVSAANARLNWQTQTPGWDFGAVKNAAQNDWNALLGRISVWGGSVARTQEFYSLLYKSLLEPQIISDTNGQYLGSDFSVHTLTSGQANQYGMFSGWDTYHSQAQLVAMLDPSAASDMATSLLNEYAQNGILPRWGYLNTDSFVMDGDPADALISDFYAFGARSFNAALALKDMLAQADSTNQVRPGAALQATYGYLPSDGVYGCCHFVAPVSSLLEYDTSDLALSMFATALGDTSDAARLRARANNWANVFDKATGLLSLKQENGAFAPPVTPTTTANYAEGSAYEYLWDVPNNYAGLFTMLGGAAKVVPELRTYLSNPNGLGTYADLSQEFGLGEQFALDYAGDPAGTQLAVNTVRDSLYQPGPFGFVNNDDLGGESSQFIWEMLGMYPENPGSGNLVLASPGFPNAVIHLPSGKTITITAPGASLTHFYVSSLAINGVADNNLYVPFDALASGATMAWTLGNTPTTWGSAPQDAPPSYG